MLTWPQNRGLQVSSRTVVVAMGVCRAGRRELQACVWQCFHGHFARNLPQRLPKAHKSVVTASLLSVYAQADASEILAGWNDPAFRHVPEPDWRKIWSTSVLGIFWNEAAIVRLVASQLLEQQEEWQLARRCCFSEATMAKVPQPDELLELSDGDQAVASDTTN